MTDPRTRADVEIFDKKVAYDGFFKLKLYDFRFRKFDGAWSGRVRREVFERGPTAAVLLYDPARAAVVLIEQMRAPAINDPAGPWLIEAIAGIVEPGESPAAVVRREAMEECGLAVGRIVPLFDCLPSPGGSSERVSLFVGEADSGAVQGIHGLDGEHEDIRPLVLPLAEALAEIGGRIVTAPAILCLQWLALNRDCFAEGAPG